MDVIYRISKLVVWCGDSSYSSHKYLEVGFTKNIELINKLRALKIQEENIWPINKMYGWPMYLIEKIELIENYDSDGDYIINPVEPY